jgi:hypothetical protein
MTTHKVGDTFTSTKTLDGGTAKITLLDGELYTVKQVLADAVVAEGWVHIKQEGKYPVNTFAVVEFLF